MKTALPPVPPATPATSTLIYWFRNDLRLEDNPGLIQACRQAHNLLLVYCHNADPAQRTRWHVPRTSMHRQHFLATTLADLAGQLQARGSELLEVQGDPAQLLPALARAIGATAIHCEEIAAPQEQAELAALRAAGLRVEAVWQSSLLEPTDLPFAPAALPDVFTQFRTLVERASVLPRAALPAPPQLPSLPPGLASLAGQWRLMPAPVAAQCPMEDAQARSSFPYARAQCHGGASAAAAHVRQYFERQLAHTYKLTRNGLTGVDYSTKFSPWLASGALSARQAYAALKQFEAAHGASDGSYWIWFELLWRDYFRLLHMKYGARLYRAQGLTDLPAPVHDARKFDAWCQASTGEPLVDAAMTELAATGYLSNRLRQVVASYLVHDLGCDWRAGAAWFEAQLVDYDVYSNEGNWLYIAGRGTDPRLGRRFNVEKQAREHDPDGSYQRRWRCYDDQATRHAQRRTGVE